MITLLADHNIEGQARLLLGTLQALGWTELLNLRLATFAEVELGDQSTDREVWRRAQVLGMLLLTDNRNNEGPDALEQTLLEELTPSSLPVLTVGSGERLRRDRSYRIACAERVAEIVVDLETYRGVARLLHPLMSTTLATKPLARDANFDANAREQWQSYMNAGACQSRRKPVVRHTGVRP